MFLLHYLQPYYGLLFRSFGLLQAEKFCLLCSYSFVRSFFRSSQCRAQVLLIVLQVFVLGLEECQFYCQVGYFVECCRTRCNDLSVFLFELRHFLFKISDGSLIVVLCCQKFNDVLLKVLDSFLGFWKLECVELVSGLMMAEVSNLIRLVFDLRQWLCDELFPSFQ